MDLSDVLNTDPHILATGHAGKDVFHPPSFSRCACVVCGLEQGADNRMHLFPGQFQVERSPSPFGKAPQNSSSSAAMRPSLLSESVWLVSCSLYYLSQITFFFFFCASTLKSFWSPQSGTTTTSFLCFPLSCFPSSVVSLPHLSVSSSRP